MKKLLNTLYVTSSDRYLSLDGENIVILDGKTEIGRVPLHNLEAVVTFGFTGASPALMGACAKRNITLCFMSPYGEFLARVTGTVKGNVILRKEQYRLSESDNKSVMIARNFIVGKLFNARWVVERVTRDNAMRIDVERFKQSSQNIQRALENAAVCESLDSLRGIEGEASRTYFALFNEMILQQKEAFHFDVRNKRPPLDPVNALLSFMYTLLSSMCASALETAGLDPYVGYLHRDRPGRISLALDLMEEFRSVLADRFVLTLINKRIVTLDGFKQSENGAIVMDDETRKKVLSAWQARKQETLVHPFLGEKVEWGMVPYAQAMLLARFIRGDLDAYPPFMWK
ncbi:MAG: type I-C CRISPR-associated endonuclease Cas1c [Odoribacter sp.]